MRTDKFLSILVSSLALLPSSRCSQTFSRDSDGTVSSCFGGSTGCSGSSTLTTHQSEQRGLAFTQGETGGKIQSLGKRYEYAQACYGEPLPDIPGSKERRTTPWGSREMVNVEGGESCCTSLEEVRRGIDAVDKQLLELLAKRLSLLSESWGYRAFLFYRRTRPVRLLACLYHTNTPDELSEGT